jgi:hypothetical protein
MISLFLKNEELYLTQQVNKVLHFNSITKTIRIAYYPTYIDFTKNNDGYDTHHLELVYAFNILTLFAEREL